MALTVEDGTGVTDADSYQTLANILTYLTNRNLTALNSQTSAIQEGKIRLATERVDEYLAKVVTGQKMAQGQALLFPMNGTIFEGFLVANNSIPAKLWRACAHVAEDLQKEEDDGRIPAGIKESTADGSTTIYFQNSLSFINRFEIAHRLLSGFFVSERQRYAM